MSEQKPINPGLIPQANFTVAPQKGAAAATSGGNKGSVQQSNQTTTASTSESQINSSASIGKIVNMDTSMNQKVHDISQLERTESQLMSKPAPTAPVLQAPKMTIIERKRMKDVMSINLYNQAEEERKGGDKEKAVESQIKKEQEITKVVKKDMMTQKEALQQRLAERKRSRIVGRTGVNPRRNSVNPNFHANNTLNDSLVGLGDMSSLGLSRLVSKGEKL